MALSLDRVVALLESLAPLHHAESWDNVGLLLAPLADRRDPADALECALPAIKRADGIHPLGL